MSDLFDRNRKFNPMDTSVDDAMQSVRQSTSIADLRDWIKHERDGRGRATIIKGIAARIRRIEKGIAAVAGAE